MENHATNNQETQFFVCYERRAIVLFQLHYLLTKKKKMIGQVITHEKIMLIKEIHLIAQLDKFSNNFQKIKGMILLPIYGTT